MQNLVSDTKKDRDQLENFSPGSGPAGTGTGTGTTLQIPISNRLHSEYKKKKG